MEEKISIPEKVEKAIGYRGWTALSWALQNGWVQDYKYSLSQKEGRDIGTKETVEAIVYPWSCTKDRLDLLSQGALFLFQDRLEMKKRDKAVKLMIEGYLMGTDFVSPLWVMSNGKMEQTGIIPDEHGENQLEGELRRYWAKEKEILPSEVILTKAIVREYCKVNGLSNQVYKLAC